MKRILLFLWLSTLVGFAQQSTIGGSRGGTPSPVPGGTFYVDDGGSDSGTGSSTDPLRTIGQAITNLGGSGTIIMRGGTYTNQSVYLGNSGEINIRNYPGERVVVMNGIGIAPSSFAALSNGVVTVTPPAAFAQALTFWTNTWDQWAPVGRAIYLHQTNVPNFWTTNAGQVLAAGSQGLMMTGPSLTRRNTDTNRCEHTSLWRARSVESLSDRTIQLAAGQLTAAGNAMGAIATVATNNHGFSQGQVVTIAGANETAYNGTFLVRSATDSVFTYFVFGGVSASPATGTITVTRRANGFWYYTGGTLYVRFGSNSPSSGGVVVSSTNIDSSFVYGGTPSTKLKVQGISSFFGRSGFDFSGCGDAEFVGCLGYGSGDNAFQGTSTIAPFGSVSLRHCEGAAYNGFGFNTEGDTTAAHWSSAREEMCYWHDYIREGSAGRDAVARVSLFTTCLGGRDGDYGFIDQGSHSMYGFVYSTSNAIAPAQLGQVAGQSSVGRYFNSVFDGLLPQGGIVTDDFNDHVWAVNCQFSTGTGPGISVNGNNSSQSVRALGNMYSSYLQNPIVSSAGSLNAVNFQEGFINFGTPAATLVGATPYGAANLFHGNVAVIGASSSFSTAGAASIGTTLSVGGLTTFGGGFNMSTNAPTGWATAAAVGGQSYFYNSNATIMRIKPNSFSTVFTATNTVP